MNGTLPDRKELTGVCVCWRVDQVLRTLGSDCHLWPMVVARITVVARANREARFKQPGAPSLSDRLRAVGPEEDEQGVGRIMTPDPFASHQGTSTLLAQSLTNEVIRNRSHLCEQGTCVASTLDGLERFNLSSADIRHLHSQHHSVANRTYLPMHDLL